MSVWLPIVLMLGSIFAILLWALIADRRKPQVTAVEEDEYTTGEIAEEEEDDEA